MNKPLGPRQSRQCSPRRRHRVTHSSAARARAPLPTRVSRTRQHSHMRIEAARCFCILHRPQVILIIIIISRCLRSNCSPCPPAWTQSRSPSGRACKYASGWLGKVSMPTFRSTPKAVIVCTSGSRVVYICCKPLSTTMRRFTYHKFYMFNWPKINNFYRCFVFLKGTWH